MRCMYFSVSGVDPNEGAEIAFVRCRGKDPASCEPLPGVQVGQFSIAFLLPDGCSADNIVATHDKSGKGLLSGVAPNAMFDSGDISVGRGYCS